MKKIFTLIAAMLLVPWVGWGQGNWIDDANTSWYNENENTFEISTAEELAGLAKLVNEGNNFSEKTIVLAKDILLNENVLNAEKQLNSGSFKEWTPIGNFSRKFSGTFDGNNKKIVGIYIKNEFDTSIKNKPQCIGLFGHVSNTNIRNVNIIDSYIENIGLPGHIWVGGVIGRAGGNAEIENSNFDGLIVVKAENYTSSAGDFNIHGIVGVSMDAKNIKVEGCYNEANIEVSLNSVQLPATELFDMIAGIGYGTEIINSYNIGNISVSLNEVKSNGLILISGIGDTGSINSCYNLGNLTVSGTDNSTYIYIGGITSYTSSPIQYCYNYGYIDSTIENASGCGIISGFGSTYEKNYYLQQDNAIPAIGGTTTGDEQITKATKEQFANGEIAYELRKAGAKYGQLQNNPNNDATPVLLAFEENKGKEVYKRTLDYNKYKGNATQATELEDYVNSGNLWLPKLNENEGWYDAEGNLYTNESTLSPDIFEITLYAEAQTPYTITISEMEGGKVEANETTAIKGETITLTVTPNEGYNYIDESLTVKAGEETITVTPGENGTYTFIMPDADVTVSATFAKVKYTVTIGELTNGSITIGEESKIEAVFVPGDPVSLNITPDEGYDIDQLFLNDVEITGTTFEMPAANVVVTATFKLKPVEDDDEDTGAIKKRYRLYLADQDFYLNDEYDEAGLVLYSRHDKKYTDVGGSFTVWFEKNGEVNEGARVFISNRANGEYKEVKLDEVSGYYQIRNVQSNIYVKLYTEEGFPVANEAIEATDARAYAQANKIVVITPEPTAVQIISMAGAVVATAQVAEQQEFANLAEGVYIVRMGKEIVKLQVRN